MATRPASLEDRSLFSSPVDTAAPRVFAAELIVLIVALAASIALYLAGGYGAVAWVAPPALLIVLGVANWTMIRADPAALWTPLFAFRLSALVFLGFGGILSENISLEAQATYLSELTYTSQEAAKVFVIWLTGVVMTLSGCFVWQRLADARQNAAARSYQDVRRVGSDRAEGTFQLGALFALVGLGFAYLVRIPIELGIFPISTVPGAISTMFDAALAVGVFLLSVWALKRGGLALALIPAVVLPASFVGLLLLTKQGVLLPMIFFGLAYLFTKITAARVAVIATLLIAAFSILQPLVSYARNATPEGAVMDPGARLSVMAEYLGSGDQSSGSAETDFLRFGHTHVAAFVIDQHDSGMPSEELRNSLFALVPRIVWPDKPSVTQGAADLYFLVTGREGSALAATTLADLYWNAGWIGVLLISPIWGILMAIATAKSVVIVRQRDWFLMPFVLLVFMIGLSQESAFTVSVFVPSAIAFIALQLLQFGRKMLPTSSGGARTARALPQPDSSYPGYESKR